MTPPVIFLQALARAVSALQLYNKEHPSSARALQQASEALGAATSQRALTLTFTEDDVLCDATPLRPLRGWVWSKRFASAGLWRLEIIGGVGASEFEMFVGELAARLAAPVPEGEDHGFASRPHIRVRKPQKAAEVPLPASSSEPQLTTIALDCEFLALKWVHERVRRYACVPFLEADAIVSALRLALQASDEPLLLKDVADRRQDEAAALVHAVNVATLSMALASALGCGPKDLRAIGTAGLLHDVGKLVIDPQPAADDGASSDDSNERHSADGARVLLRSDPRLDLAAVVAFEHHLLPDGGSRPCQRFTRDTHWGTRVVQVCNSYEHARTLDAATYRGVDESVLKVFVELMNRKPPRIVELSAGTIEAA
jgi:putative nucleotidyltransferase with HDIG domain